MERDHASPVIQVVDRGAHRGMIAGSATGRRGEPHNRV
jgi:hypothetical protein